MNEQQFANAVRQRLNQGLELDPAKRERLRAARAQALARLRPQAEPAFGWAGDMLARFDGWRGFSIRVLLPLAVVVLAASAIYTWQEKRRVAELVDIDAQLLTDDLPIDAYLDRGFQNWLKSGAAGE